MSILSLISDIKSNIFVSNKQSPNVNNTPILNNEYIPDLESGEGVFYKRLNEPKIELDLYSKKLNFYLEKEEKNISFMDIINYFRTPITKQDIPILPYTIDDVIVSDSKSDSSSNIIIDDFQEIPLNF